MRTAKRSFTANDLTDLTQRNRPSPPRTIAIALGACAYRRLAAVILTEPSIMAPSKSYQAGEELRGHPYGVGEPARHQGRPHDSKMPVQTKRPLARRPICRLYWISAPERHDASSPHANLQQLVILHSLDTGDSSACILVSASNVPKQSLGDFYVYD